MLRSLRTRARRQRFVAFLSVIVLALAVPPAFGGGSITAQVARALKLATKANANAAKAVKLASAAEPAAAGAPGAAGAKGATGATGPAGATGATGAAGPTGAKGDKGEKGDTGATGPMGPAGPAAAAGSGGGAPKSLSTFTPDMTMPTGFTVPLTDRGTLLYIARVTPEAGTAYVVTAHVNAHATDSTAASFSCLLMVDKTTLDSSWTTLPYGGFAGDATLTALVPAADKPDPVDVVCSGSAGSMQRVQASVTGIAVTP